MKILVGGRIIEGVIREKEQAIKSLGKKIKRQLGKKRKKC